MNDIVKIFASSRFSILLLIPMIWLIFVVSRFLPVNRLGLVPRKISGLVGLVTMPFLHSDFRHLMSNTVPLLLLVALLAYRPAGERLAPGLEILVVVSLFGGILLWLLGRSAVHIGASLLVFGLAGFHVAIGVLEKQVSSVVIAIVVAGLYGTTVVGGMNPFKRGVSWEGHLIGFVAGILVAAMYTGDVVFRLPG